MTNDIQQTKEAIEKLQDDGYRACPFPQMVEEGALRVSHLKALAADHTLLQRKLDRLMLETETMVRVNGKGRDWFLHLKKEIEEMV